MKRDEKGKKVIIEQWAGRWTFRVRLWRLWFGVNFRYWDFFIIWNGPVHNWQVRIGLARPWKPLFAHWRTGNKYRHVGILTEEGARRINRPELCGMRVRHDGLQKPFRECANRVFCNGLLICRTLSIFSDTPGIIPVISIEQRVTGMIITTLALIAIFVAQ